MRSLLLPLVARALVRSRSLVGAVLARTTRQGGAAGTADASRRRPGVPVGAGCETPPASWTRRWRRCVQRLDRRLDRGVTLIEAMIVVAICGILLATAVPSFSRLASLNRTSAAVNDLVHAMSVARNEALRRGHRVYLAPTGNRWRDGWVVFVDRNDDRRYDPPSASRPDETIVLHDALPATITITNPSNPSREPFTDIGSPQRTYVMFDGAGYPRQRNGGFSVGSLLVVDSIGSARTVRTICLSAYGRVRVIEDARCS